MTQERVRSEQQQAMSSRPTHNGSLHRRAVHVMPLMHGEHDVRSSQNNGGQINTYYNFLNTPLLGEAQSTIQQKESNYLECHSIQVGITHLTAQPADNPQGKVAAQTDDHVPMQSICQRMDTKFSKRKLGNEKELFSSKAVSEDRAADISTYTSNYEAAVKINSALRSTSRSSEDKEIYSKGKGIIEEILKNGLTAEPGMVIYRRANLHNPESQWADKEFETIKQSTIISGSTDLETSEKVGQGSTRYVITVQTGSKYLKVCDPARQVRDEKIDETIEILLGGGYFTYLGGGLSKQDDGVHVLYSDEKPDVSQIKEYYKMLESRRAPLHTVGVLGGSRAGTADRRRDGVFVAMDEARATGQPMKLWDVNW